MGSPKKEPRAFEPEEGNAKRAWPWLLLGMALIVASNLRWGIGALAWVAPLPILRWLRQRPGRWPRVAVALALPVAWTAATLKIITPPVPPIAAFGFGIPIGFFFAVPYLTWDWLRRRSDDWRTVIAFPSLMVGVEWVQAQFTPLGSWGAAAYTQLENLPLLQLASLFGPAGIGWLIYGSAAALDRAWVAQAGERRRWLAAVVLGAVAAHGYGWLRLVPTTKSERMALVAAVGTDATFSGLPLPSDGELARIEETLFQRTRIAAAAGASLVVWNEAATLVPREREPRFLGRVAELSRSAGIELVAAYLVPLSLEPLRYENKYAWLRSDGRIDHIYLKHEPVPGEPAVRGIEPPKVVVTSFGRATGAICYDYDFPRLARSHAKLGIDLVALPSSDWLGIDPIHTRMAALRAIEGGFSIVRSTRAGSSAGIDRYGRTRGWLSANESGGKILYVTVPVERVETVHGVIGDLLVYGGYMYVALLIALLGVWSAPRWGGRRSWCRGVNDRMSKGSGVEGGCTAGKETVR